MAILGADRLIYSHLLGANPAALFGGELLEATIDAASGRAHGAAVPLSPWPDPVAGLSASRSGSRILLRNAIVQHSVFVCELGGHGSSASEPRRITFGIGREDLPRAWSRDAKRLFFDTNRYGKWEIYTQVLDGPEEPFIRTSDDVFSPRLSPDGKSVLFIDRPERMAGASADEDPAHPHRWRPLAGRVGRIGLLVVGTAIRMPRETRPALRSCATQRRSCCVPPV